MDVNQVYSICQYIVGKNISQGYLSSSEFEICINSAQRQYVDYLLGEYQKYQVGRPIAVVEFSGNERIRESISPLIYNAILPINATTGIAERPSDFEYVDQMWSIYGNYNIRFVQQERFFSYKDSEIDPVVENPVYLIRHEGFQFFPVRPYEHNQAAMSYVRTPPSIVWGYVLDSNGIPVWNPATSQNPVWGQTDMMNIIVRALLMVGVNLDYKQVLAYSNDIKNGGQ